MKTKHTPEPWIVTEDGEPNFFGITTKNNWLMRVQFNGELSASTQKSNVRLISASPMLFKSLQKLILSIEIIDGQEPPDNDDLEYLHRCILTAKKTLYMAGG